MKKYFYIMLQITGKKVNLKDNRLRVCLLFITFIFASVYVNAQVGIGTTTPNSSAVLDLSSTNKGLLIPRMTSSQRTAISSPVNGLIVFDSDSGYVFFYNSGWKGLKATTGSSSAQWTTSGSDIYNNNSGNTGIGKTSPSYKLDVSGPVNADSFMLSGNRMIKSDNENTFVGQGIGFRSTGGTNTAVGYLAFLNNTSGQFNAILGKQAGYYNTTGAYNTFLGTQAGYGNISASKNIMIGYQAGYNNNTGSTNNFVGYKAGYSNTTGYNNTYSGYTSGYTNSTGAGNAFYGGESGFWNTGDNNTFVGEYAGNSNSTGSNNTTLGSGAGAVNTTGSKNTFIGTNADANSSNLYNAAAIGYEAKASQNNTMILGATGTYQPVVGIGTNTPDSSALLDVTSTSKGFLMPRMTSSQRTSISSPAKGLMVFDNDSSYFFYYSGSSWQGIKNSGGSTTNYWARSGTNTTLANSGDNVGVGKTPSYKLDVSGPVNADSIMLGGKRILGTPGTANLFIGESAGNHNSGNNNSLMGYQAGFNNTTGGNNSFIGYQAGFNNTTATNNTFIGLQVGRANTTGSDNTFMGVTAGLRNTDGAANVFIGRSAGRFNTSGSLNTFIGDSSGLNSILGNGNTFLGRHTGNNNNYGSNITLIGNAAEVNLNNLTNATAIGYNAKVAQSNSLILGATGSDQPNVGIGTTAPDVSALLELKSTSQGLLMPRMSSSQRTSISSPAKGLVVFDNDSSYIFYYDGSNWKGLKNSSGTSSAQWTTSGSDIYNNNSGNTGIGKTSPSYKLDVDGGVNADSFMSNGNNVLYTRSNFNTQVGIYAGSNTTTGNNNTNVGNATGRFTTSGSWNVFMGNDAGRDNTTGYKNVYIGFQSGVFSNGAGNAYIGYKSGFNTTSGNNNTYSGYASGFSNSIGAGNAFYGSESGFLSTGDNNTFIGMYAAHSNSTGFNNTFLGSGSGITNTTGSRNTFIGTNADANSASLYNAAAIGYEAKASQNNTMILGATGTYQPVVGIGTTIPDSSALLDVTSTSKGFLMPRMSSSQRTSISSPAKGLMVFDNDSSYFFYYDGSNWTGMKNSTAATSTNYWARSGTNVTLVNSGDNVGINKTPSYPLDVKGHMNADTLMLGGVDALISNSSNVFLGQGAGVVNSTGYANTFLGVRAGENNTSGIYNIFIGSLAGKSNTTGNGNIFSGLFAGSGTTTGSYNYFGGTTSGLNNTTGDYNTFMGTNSGNGNTTGQQNVSLGYGSGYSGSTGDLNTYIGTGAGNHNITGSQLTTVGGFADVDTDGLVNATAIGYGAKVGQSNSVVLGSLGTNVGIGITKPNSSAVLDLTSTSQGLLMPRMSSFQRTILASPAKGLIVFDNDSSYFFYYDGSNWKGLKNSSGSTSSQWTTSGSDIYNNNSGNTGIGVSSPVSKLDVSGMINSDSIGLAGSTFIKAYSANQFIGFNTGQKITTGDRNTFIGADAGQNNTTGFVNVFIGQQAGQSNIDGAGNTFIGSAAGVLNSSGSNGTYVGRFAGGSNTTGSANTFLGRSSGSQNTTGSQNVALGTSSGFSQKTGDNNSYSGYESGFNNATGSNNTFSGAASGIGNYSGTGNTALGAFSGANTNGAHNTFLGDSSDASSSGLSNATAIGYNAKVGQSNSIVLGGTGSDQPNVGIGTTTPSSSALLDLTSTTQGMLMPRMTSSQRTSISSPATGLMVFDTDSGYVFFYNSGWKGVKATSASGTQWTTSGTNIYNGNSGNVGVGNTSPSYKLDVSGPVNADSILLGGTTMISAKGLANTNVGSEAGLMSTGNDNTFVGSGAGRKNSGGFNIIIGENSGQFGTGSFNTAVGIFSGYQSGFTGSKNSMFGYGSGSSITSGSNNTLMGYQTGLNITTGDNNTISGHRAGLRITTGNNNVFTGSFTGSVNTTGAQNTFIGTDAGLENSTGDNNVYLGAEAGRFNITGAGNTSIGTVSGNNNSGGSRNTFLGDSADASTGSLTNATAIGYNAKVGQSNSIVLGTTGSSQPNVGVGTTTPNSSALLDLTSTTQGMLMPRMTSSQRTSISSPATGLMVFDTDSGYVFFYNSGWKGVKSNGANSSTNYWNRSGTNTTLANTSDLIGIGKTPSYKFDVNGPVNADSFMSSGSTVMNFKSNNTIIGTNSGPGNTGAFNTFIGFEAGKVNSSGNTNIFLGYQAGSANTTGSKNTFTGTQAGHANTTGGNNHFDGYKSGIANTTGSNNYFSGFATGFNNTTGNNNSYSGANGGFANTTGENNSFYGYDGGRNINTGYSNTGIGSTTGNTITVGSRNTFIGDSADAGSNNLTNATAIGYNAKVNTSNSIVLGNGSVKVGIGASSPSDVLDVNGNIVSTGGNHSIKGSSFVSNATGSSSYFGSTDMGFYGVTGGGMQFVAKGSNILKLDTSGNVGIGTTSPGAKLEVVGGLRLSNSSANSDFQFNTATRSTIYPSGSNVPTNLGLQMRSKGTGVLELNSDNNGNIQMVSGGGMVGVNTSSPSSTLQVNGSIGVKRTAYTSTSTIASTDHICAVTTTSSITLTLPSAATAGSGREYIVKAETTSAPSITLSPASSEKIDGSTSSKTITAAAGVLRLYSDGTNWWTY